MKGILGELGNQNTSVGSRRSPLAAIFMGAVSEECIYTCRIYGGH